MTAGLESPFGSSSRLRMNPINTVSANNVIKYSWENLLFILISSYLETYREAENALARFLKEESSSSTADGFPKATHWEHKKILRRLDKQPSNWVEKEPTLINMMSILVKNQEILEEMLNVKKILRRLHEQPGIMK